MKDKLKTQIVKRKYFGPEDPPMLTWAEKEQIRLLNTQDPIEWSPDRLCESFPATRDAILRVLRTKWSPKSVKVVTGYDERVMKNWENYKAGRLLVSAELRSHLAKFKDRKIEPMSPEEIAKRIVKQKPVFPKPKSTMFSSIIQRYLDANPKARDDVEDNEVSDKKPTKKSPRQIASGESMANDSSALKVTGRLEKLAQRTALQEPITFDEFLEHRVENIHPKDVGPVNRVLIDEYKTRKNEAYRAKNLTFEDETPEKGQDKKSDADEAKCLVFESESPVGAWKELEVMKDKFEKITFTDKREASEQTELAQIDRSPAKTEVMTRMEDRQYDGLVIADKGSLETGIIARHKKNESLEEDYPDYIKIPAKKYKQGVTYRVEDRYYDDDGEFLYRVIGLKS